MQINKHLSFLTAFLATGAVAKFNYYSDSELCASACGVSLYYISFDGAMPAGKAGPGANEVACTEPMWAQSLFYCSTVYCSSSNLDKALAAQNRTCRAVAGVSLPPYSTPATDNATTISLAQAYKMSFTGPVVPDQDFYQLGYESTKSSNTAQRMNWDLTWGLYGYWGLVLVIGTVNRVISIARSSQSARSDPIEAATASLTQQKRSLPARSSTWFQRRLVIPFTYGSKAFIAAGSHSLPNRLETFLLGLYLAMNFAFCFPGYHLFTQDILLIGTKTQLAKYLGNRFGSLALANVPVVWIFATRNDPLLWLTGWSYATYSQFHRWSARILLALGIAHAATYSILVSYSGKAAYKHLFTVPYVQWGTVAIAAFSLLVGLSFYFIRKRVYDLWLMTHIVLALIVLVALYRHVSVMSTSYNGFIWFSVAIWSFDRAMRIARLVYINAVPTAKGARATAVYDSETDTIRLNVTDYFRNSPPAPGSFYYIYEPARLRGYESHPFTLCTWPDAASSAASRGGSTSAAASSRSMQKHEKSLVDSDGASTSTSSPAWSVRSPSARQHTFLIKPRRGFTDRLRKLAGQRRDTESPRAREVAVLLEGPYGSPLRLDAHSNVTLVVGGSGISAAVSRVHALLEGPGGDGSGSSVRVHLVWAVQRRALADDIAAHELAAALAHPRFRLDLYVTQQAKEGDADANMPDALAPASVRAGRPDIYALLADERARSAGSLAVMVCGPPLLESACRRAVVRLLGEPGPKVDFFDERFGW